jgi:hypothetical protein
VPVYLSAIRSLGGQPGLALLALLFAPQLELRTDRRRSRVLGVSVPGAMRELVYSSLRLVISVITLVLPVVH